MLLCQGADPNARDNWNYTPLHEAGIKGKIDVCIGEYMKARQHLWDMNVCMLKECASASDYTALANLLKITRWKSCVASLGSLETDSDERRGAEVENSHLLPR